jgi:molybdate transport system substrate-binding protein
MLVAVFLLLLWPWTVPGYGKKEVQALTVFAAASLTVPLQKIATAYAETGAGRVDLSFAASSILARQIAGGAPCDIFISADRAWMDHLLDEGLITPENRRNLLGNTLVMVAPLDSRGESASADIQPALNLSPHFGLEGEIMAILGSGRMAMGDPAYVPAGIYGREAMVSLGVWMNLRHRLIPTANDRLATVLVERGDAPLGIVYASDARTSHALRLVAAFPQSSHAPIVYPLGLIGDSAEARDFRDFLFSEKASAIFTGSGFQTIEFPSGNR